VKEISIGIFLDLSKAFDLVNHDILLRKMARMGITGGCIKMVSVIFRKQGTNRGTCI
jgi:hypothetical protein